MKRLILIWAVFVLLGCHSAFGAACSSTSLGNTWTCVTGGFNTGATGVQVIITTAVNAHDKIFAFCDTGNAVANGGANSVTDNQGNSYTQMIGPVSWKSQDGIAGNATAGYWVAMDAKAATAGGTTLTCGGSSQPAAFADISVALFRTSNASPTVTTDNTNSAVVNSAGGTCPCALPSISLSTAGTNDLLVIMAQNQGAGPTAPPSGFIFADGVGYIFAESIPSPTTTTANWSLGSPTDASDNAVQMFGAIRFPGASAPIAPAASLFAHL